MKVAPIAAVKAHLSAFIEQTTNGPIIITKNGRPVAALVAISDDDELERLMLAHSPRFRRLLEASEESIRREGALSSEEFWALVDAQYADKEHPASS